LGLFKQSVIELPAFPTSKIIDPTGCGDSFAGALLAHLSLNPEINIEEDVLTNALIHANVTASFTIEEMGVSGIEKLRGSQYEERLLQYMELINNN